MWSQSRVFTCIPCSPCSGKFFDLRLFSLFGIFLGFEYSALKTATARTTVLMLTWEVADILDQASGARGPALPNYWKALALYTISTELVASRGGATYTAKVCRMNDERPARKRPAM